MEHEIQKRRRAVRLKPDALSALAEALRTEWQKNPQHPKLTREEQARILGVSLTTSQRILKNLGADKASLSIAFRSVGLPWSDDYCETAGAQPEILPSPASRTNQPLLRVSAIAVFALVVLSALMSFRDDQSARAQSAEWQTAYVLAYEHAENQYNQGNYRVARTEIHRAISIAREWENAPRLASALRLSGDLESASGNYKIAYARYKEAIGIREGMGEKRALPALMEAMGTAELRQLNLDSAKKYFRQSHELFRDAKDWTGVAMACRGLGRTYHLLGDLTQAEGWFEQGFSALEKVEKPDLETDLKSLQGLLLYDQGQRVRAQSLLRAALNYWMEKGHPRWVATMRMRYAQISGDKILANSLLEESKREFQRLGDMGGVAECDRLMN